MRTAILWEKVGGERVKCNLCHRRCIISRGERGACRVRQNIDGTLYSLVYGKLTSANIDPIEKKPLFHVYPGGEVMSISTVGCNFYCMFCCNWVLSQEKEVYGKTTTPEQVVEWTLKSKAEGISYTYNEPTVFFEFALETSRIANKHGLINTFVTNGYMTPEAVDEIKKYLDAATVDFKGDGNPEFYKKYMGVPSPEPIFETLKALREAKIFVEITDLVVPVVGGSVEDFKKLVGWVVENLGPETPIHVLKFHPDYKMLDLPVTPIKMLEERVKIAKDEGAHYVYVGNVPGHPNESTYCPNCGELVIERYGFMVGRINLDSENRCSKCGYKISILGRPVSKRRSFLSII